MSKTTTTKIHRHPAAIARDKWMGSETFLGLSNPKTLGASAAQRQYLENRLQWAFQAGWDAHEEHSNNNLKMLGRQIGKNRILLANLEKAGR